ncbi:hypothetical protein APA_1723 [Pseudanabaena sp. lw0831]|nr:hypothetical protein APA_1723 [Pseudanabaena sp. lw0831]
MLQAAFFKPQKSVPPAQRAVQIFGVYIAYLHYCCNIVKH